MRFRSVATLAAMYLACVSVNVVASEIVKLVLICLSDLKCGTKHFLPVVDCLFLRGGLERCVNGVASAQSGSNNGIRFDVRVEPTHVVFGVHRIDDLNGCRKCP